MKALRESWIASRVALGAAAAASLLEFSACATEGEEVPIDEQAEMDLGSKDQAYLVAPWSNHWPTVASRSLRVCITRQAGTTSSEPAMQFLVGSAVLEWVNAVQPVATVTLNGALTFTCQLIDTHPNYDLEVVLRPGIGGLGQNGDWFFSASRLQVFEQGFGGVASPLWPRILHEFGHVFGANDTYTTQTSGACQPNQPSSAMCTAGITNLTTDDINGVRQAYRLSRPWLYNYSVGFTGYRSAASNRCLDATGWGTANGTQLQIWDCGPTSNQVWRWNPTTKAIVGEHSGKCLDVWGNRVDDTAPVKLHDCHGGPNQQWEWQGDGSLRGVGSGKCLDVAGFGTWNGATLQIYQCLGGANQIWWST